MARKHVTGVCLFDWSAAAASAQQAAPPPVEQPSITIVVEQTLSSRTSRIGNTFPIRLAAPVRGADGTVLIPAGAPGQGEVIHAARAGAAGRAGEMIIAARFVECRGQQVRLGHLHLGLVGHDGSGQASAVGAAAAGASVLAPLAGPGALLAFAIKGGEVTIPAGTPASATITDPVALAACGAADQSQDREEP